MCFLMYLIAIVFYVVLSLKLDKGNDKGLFLQVPSVRTIWSLCAETERSVCSSLWCVTVHDTVLMDLMRTLHTLAAVSPTI